MGCGYALERVDQSGRRAFHRADEGIVPTSGREKRLLRTVLADDSGIAFYPTRALRRLEASGREPARAAVGERWSLTRASISQVYLHGSSGCSAALGARLMPNRAAVLLTSCHGTFTLTGFQGLASACSLIQEPVGCSRASPSPWPQGRCGPQPSPPAESPGCASPVRFPGACQPNCVSH